jgi:hypothetical protein
MAFTLRLDGIIADVNARCGLVADRNSRHLGERLRGLPFMRGRSAE